MKAFNKLLDTAPQALPGYWIGRHITLRDDYLSRARGPRTDPEMRSYFVRQARARNRDLVRALRGLTDQPTGES